MNTEVNSRTYSCTDASDHSCMQSFNQLCFTVISSCQST